MTIAVLRTTTLSSEAYVSTLKNYGLTFQQIVKNKDSMIAQLYTYISRLSGIVVPKTLYWRWNDGIGNIWIFQFVVYPKQGLTIITKFYRQQARQNESKSPKSKVIRLTESELKGIITESVKHILCESKYRVRKVGNWDCVPSNGYEFYDIPNMGKCVGIAMYVDSTTNKDIPPTYCLFRRGSNGKYFYATIVDAPEKGTKETKFLIVPLSDVPQEIYTDHHNLNLLH